MTKEFGLDKKPATLKDGIDWGTVDISNYYLWVPNAIPKVYTSTYKVNDVDSKTLVKNQEDWDRLREEED